jgi:hypothetical protein
MTACQTATTADLTNSLDALAANLEGLGLTTKVVPGSTPPRLKVTNPQVTQLTETVVATGGRDGSLSFWWSWGERIDAITETQAVAARIARVLT